MTHSETIGAIAAALAKAQAKMDGAEKNAANPHLKSNYANLSSVMDACKKHLNDNGIAITQSFAPAPDGTLCLETTLLHTSGEWLSSAIVMPLPALTPQGYGSAATYARRYGLAALAGVTQDDDDGHAASQPPARPAQAPSAPRPAPAASPPRADGQLSTRDIMQRLETLNLLEQGEDGRNKPSKLAFTAVARFSGVTRGKWSEFTQEQLAAICDGLDGMLGDAPPPAEPEPEEYTPVNPFEDQ